MHTIQQAIDDLEYFAKNVKLPMPGGDKVTPDKAPWILIGGSYPGALVSYAMHKFVVPFESSGQPYLYADPHCRAASQECFSLDILHLVWCKRSGASSYLSQ